MSASRVVVEPVEIHGHKFNYRYTGVNLEFARKWIDELRYGGRKQCTTKLRVDDSYCCLGVIQDLSDDNNWIVASSKENKIIFGVHENGTPRFTTPTIKVAEQLGFDHDQWLNVAGMGVPSRSYSGLNDEFGFTFAQIADVAEWSLLYTELIKAEQAVKQGTRWTGNLSGETIEVRQFGTTDTSERYVWAYNITNDTFVTHRVDSILKYWTPVPVEVQRKRLVEPMGSLQLISGVSSSTLPTLGYVVKMSDGTVKFESVTET